MGNMLPCLVQQAAGAATLPAMDPKRGLISLKLLMKAIHKMKSTRPGGAGGNNGKATEIDSKSSSSTPSAAAVAEDGKLVVREVLEAATRGGCKQAGAGSNNPKGAVLRSRLHGRSGPKKGKGVVRVKVVLTREEAARLLSLSAGGQKTAAQIVAEMRRMELARRGAASAWRPALASIPEEASSS